MTTTFGLRKQLRATFEEALARVPEALEAEGFGVLTEIDVQSTLKQKLAVDFRRYKILGACNPSFAYEALSAQLEAGLLMPCNVVVYEREGSTVVSAFDPMAMVRVVSNPAIASVAREVEGRLRRVIAAV